MGKISKLIYGAEDFLRIKLRAIGINLTLMSDENTQEVVSPVETPVVETPVVEAPVETAPEAPAAEAAPVQEA